MHLRLAKLAAVCVVITLTASAAFAYDTPRLTVLGSSRASVTLQVDAGNSGCPEGFAVQYVRSSDLASAGSWDTALMTGVVRTAQFVGQATYNTDPGSNSYRLSPNASHSAEMGDLYDETGVSGDVTIELDSGTSYEFRVFALAGYPGDVSPMSVSVNCVTRPQNMNCTYTQGYWKNHPSAWPIATMKLGTVSYTKTQLLNILGTPAKGNGLIILAHQLIAAKLNIAQGADPTPVSANITHADQLIGGLVCPPVGSGFLSPTSVDTDSQALDSYNNGDTNVPHCGGTTPTTHSTWGSVKTLYR